MSRTRGLQLRNLRARGGGRSVSLGWGGGGTDLAYSPLKVSYRRFSFPRFRPDVWRTKSANLTFCFVLHTPALSGPPPCIFNILFLFQKTGRVLPLAKKYSRLLTYKFVYRIMRIYMIIKPSAFTALLSVRELQQTR